MEHSTYVFSFNVVWIIRLDHIPLCLNTYIQVYITHYTPKSWHCQWLWQLSQKGWFTGQVVDYRPETAVAIVIWPGKPLMTEWWQLSWQGHWLSHGRITSCTFESTYVCFVVTKPATAYFLSLRLFLPVKFHAQQVPQHENTHPPLLGPWWRCWKDLQGQDFKDGDRHSP